MIKAGIIGATGYAGAEIARLLHTHPEAEVVWYGSRSYIDEKFSSVYGNFFKIVDSKCLDDNIDELAKECDVVFTATPQGLCASLVNDDILSRTKIIDLSADFRLKDVSVYEKWYKIEHRAPQFGNSTEAGDGNRTHVYSLEGCHSTIELHPQSNTSCLNF